MSWARRSSRRRLALPLLTLLSLVGCGTQIPPSEPTSAPTSNPCRFIALKPLDAATRRTVADEVAASPGALWHTLIDDYIGLRDAVQTCKDGD